MNPWPLAMVSLAILILIAVPSIFLYLFTTDRARGVKHAEARDELVGPHIAKVRLTHPEIIKVDRADRHPAYIVSCLGSLAFGVVVMFVDVPYSNLGSAALGTQKTLGTSLLLGSAMTLTGSLLGVRVFGKCVWPRICHNVVSSVLGDDIRIPYVLGWWGLLSTLISMGFYDYTVWASAGPQRLWTTYGGIASIFTAVMCVAMIPLFILRIRQYVTERSVLIFDGLAVMAAQDAE